MCITKLIKFVLDLKPYRVYLILSSSIFFLLLKSFIFLLLGLPSLRSLLYFLILLVHFVRGNISLCLLIIPFRLQLLIQLKMFDITLSLL